MNIKQFFIAIFTFSLLIPISFWLIKTTIVDPKPPSQLNQVLGDSSQSRQLQSFEVQEGQTNKLLNVPATSLPQFLVDLAAKKFDNILKASAAERQEMVQVEIERQADSTPFIYSDYSVDNEKKKLIINPKNIPNFKPGMYKLHLTLRTLEGEVNIEQDFTWGVLAINTNKSIYRPGEVAKLGMGVLDDEGETHCFSGPKSAKLWLTITSPSGEKEELSTENGKITDSGKCAAVSITNEADFQARYQTKESGIYTMYLESEIKNGRRSIIDYFKVEENPAFDLERHNFPTRIYPKSDYSVNFNIKANQTFDGDIEEIVPASFNIVEISPGGKVVEEGEYKKIVWSAALLKGSSHDFGYKIRFPMISPEFYLLGPIKLVDDSGNAVFQEARQWQIASDAIAFVKTATAISSGGASSTLTPTFASGGTATAGNFLILVCGSNLDATWTTPANYSLATTAVAAAPDQQIYYKVAVGGETGATCTQGTASSMVAHIYEYSGLENDASPAVVDQQNTASGTNCDTITAGSITTTEPDTLVFASFLKLRQVDLTKDDATYTQRNEFQDTGGAAGARLTTASNDKILSATATENSSYTSDTTNGNCRGHNVAFRADADINQVGYRFYANADSVTAGSAITAQNSQLNLSSSGQIFRLRLILNVTGYQIATNGRTFKLQVATRSAGSCGAYADVTGSTNIKFYTANSPADGDNAGAVSGQDPQYEATTTRIQDYEEANNFSNTVSAIAAGESPFWDFALQDNVAAGTQAEYCLRAVYSDGTALENYGSGAVAIVSTYGVPHLIINPGVTLEPGTTITAN